MNLKVKDKMNQESEKTLEARLQKEIKKRDLFDEIAGDILRHAEYDGVLESVNKMMMIYLFSGKQK